MCRLFRLSRLSRVDRLTDWDRRVFLLCRTIMNRLRLLFLGCQVYFLINITHFRRIWIRRFVIDSFRLDRNWKFVVFTFCCLFELLKLLEMPFILFELSFSRC